MELDLEIRPQEFTQFTLMRNTECIYRLCLFTPKLCTLITSFATVFSRHHKDHSCGLQIIF